MNTKTCSKCKGTLPVAQFNRLASSKDGYSYVCKECYKQNEHKRVAQMIRKVDVTRKACSQCQRQKQLDMFYNSPSSRDGHLAV
jgi:hypothetical protein